MNVYSLNEIKSENITRFSTGMIFLDRIFGTNGKEFGEDGFQAGLAKGSLVMLAGEAGAGKSRLAIEIGANINRRGGRILTFQLEVSPADYKSWTKDKVANPDSFYVSDERDHRKQIEIIKELKPHFVIVDSVNRYDVTYQGVADLIDELQACARETGTIMLLIGQLDKKGNKMMVRGSQDWTFLPDVVALVYRRFEDEKFFITKKMNELYALAGKMDVKVTNTHKFAAQKIAKTDYANYMKSHEGVFRVGIPDKNRYGRTGGECSLRHTESGVEVFRRDYSIEELMSL